MSLYFESIILSLVDTCLCVSFREGLEYIPSSDGNKKKMRIDSNHGIRKETFLVDVYAQSQNP